MKNKKVEFFLRKDIPTITAYEGISAIKKELIKHSAVIVLDEDDSRPIGVLTPMDVLSKPHNLVVDCLSPKPSVRHDSTVEAAYTIIQENNTDAAIVHRENEFEGIILRKDILHYLAHENASLSNLVVTQEGELQDKTSSIRKTERIIKSIFDSTKSFRLLLAPDYSILFFNKTAFEHIFSCRQGRIKQGDNLFSIIQEPFEPIEPLFKPNFKRAMQGEHVISEFGKGKGQDAVWYRAEYYPVYEKNKLIGISISIANISDRKRNEMIIEEQNKTLRDILFLQSHEVRRPVASILGIVDALDKANLSRENRALVEMLDTATKELDDIIKAIVTMAHFNSKKN